MELYVQYLLGSSVSRQFDAFIAGFRTVCNSPAFDVCHLSLSFLFSSLFFFSFPSPYLPRELAVLIVIAPPSMYVTSPLSSLTFFFLAYPLRALLLFILARLGVCLLSFLFPLSLVSLCFPYSPFSPLHSWSEQLDELYIQAVRSDPALSPYSSYLLVSLPFSSLHSSLLVSHN